jgi:anti-anti-sigma regulatory factor
MAPIPGNSARSAPVGAAAAGGRIDFANPPRLRQEPRAWRERYDPRVLAIDRSAVPNRECTALRSLIQAPAASVEAGSSP